MFPIAYSDKFYKDVLDPRTADFCKFGAVSFFASHEAAAAADVEWLDAVPVFYNDLPVGAICCRIEHPTPSSSSAEATPKLYIMTLGVLAPYRRLGLASRLLSHVLSAAEKTHVPPEPDPAAPATPAVAAETKGVEAGKKGGKKDKKVKSDATKPEASAPTATTATPDPVPALGSAYVHVQVGNEDAKTFYAQKGFEVEGEVEGYYKKVTPKGAWVIGRKIEAPAAAATDADANVQG